MRTTTPLTKLAGYTQAVARAIAWCLTPVDKGAAWTHKGYPRDGAGGHIPLLALCCKKDQAA
jgi:hypothetical protein